MKIYRRGARRDHGESYIELKAPQFSWNYEQAAVNLRKADVLDFSSPARHGYKVELPVPELASLLAAVAYQATVNPEIIRQALAPALPSIRAFCRAAGGTFSTRRAQPAESLRR